MRLEHEKSEIKKTIQLFFDGFDNLDAELIIKAFYSDKAERKVDATTVITVETYKEIV